MDDVFDLLVIGGGINGAGIARDAAGRGLRVVLCEKDDLAQGTSSRSSKLVHGGLRYLEHFEFRLVRESLGEREVLLRSAPHLVRPLRFVLPHSAAQRPAWMIRLGLLLYDHLGRRRVLGSSRRLDLRRAPEGAALREAHRTGFAYWDCWTDDARLVVANALDAAARGAEILLHTEVEAARREDGVWRVGLRRPDGARREVRARALANAAGPWVEPVIEGTLGLHARVRVRLVKGSHIVTRRTWPGEQAYTLQNDDGRVVFVIPYEDAFSLIGTTDIPYSGRPEAAAVGADERDYLLRAVNRYGRKSLTAADIVHAFAGIRPLHDDGGSDAASVTRDYAFDLQDAQGQAPVLSVFGGKITTYRRLAEHALARLAKYFSGLPGAWTAGATLPGGDLPDGDPVAYCARLQARHPWLAADLARHYARLYGTRAEALLEGLRTPRDLGRHFGGLLHQREAEFLRRTEWASSPQDVLERRTKHGLHMTEAEREAFAAWMVQPPASLT
ncbi:MAG: glycerol-3-phosphate dehydrogenase [Acidisphaera sp.]|nr:glycerol-3-phosphate dehydrogenase [Acidisphaera sp.]